MKNFYYLLIFTIIIGISITNHSYADNLNISQKSDTIKKNIISNKKKLQLDKSVPLIDKFKDISINNDDIENLNLENMKPLKYNGFSDSISFKDTILYNPGFLPIVFDGKIIPDSLNFIQKIVPKVELGKNFHLIPKDSTFEPQLTSLDFRNTARKHYYKNYPQNITLSAVFVNKKTMFKESISHKKNAINHFLKTSKAVKINTTHTLEKHKIQHAHWLKRGEHTLQFNQNGLSKNWYAGGDGYFGLINYHMVNLEYKKNKVDFNNTVEWRLNLQSSPADTIHKLNIIDDYARIYSTLSIDAFRNWAYSANLEAKTPFFNSYPINSKKKRTALFSPLQLNIGIGMQYRYTFKSPRDRYKNADLKLDLSPFATYYTYVNDKQVDPTTFGINNGKFTKVEVGSSINLNLTYNFNMFSNITSRFKYFTNYNRVIVESENKFTFALNKYLSASTYLYLRFDDGVPLSKKDATWGYFQYNEMLGFGLSYKWKY